MMILHFSRNICLNTTAALACCTSIQLRLFTRLLALDAHLIHPLIPSGIAVEQLLHASWYVAERMIQTPYRSVLLIQAHC
jgi:hypothetical protein